MYNINKYYIKRNLIKSGKVIKSNKVTKSGKVIKMGKLIKRGTASEVSTMKKKKLLYCNPNLQYNPDGILNFEANSTD